MRNSYKHNSKKWSLVFWRNWKKYPRNVYGSIGDFLYLCSVNK